MTVSTDGSRMLITRSSYSIDTGTVVPVSVCAKADKYSFSDFLPRDPMTYQPEFSIARAEPEAVVIVGAYKPVAEFIKLSRKTGFNPVFVNISFVGANALAVWKLM